MKKYGADIRHLAEATCSGPTSGDPSADVVVLLAQAYAAAERLQEEGVDLMYRGKPLLLGSIKRAFREALEVRSKRVPPEMLDTSVISKLGRYYGEGKVSDRTGSG